MSGSPEAKRRHYDANRGLWRRRNDERRARLIAWVDDQKRAPCADCGVEYPPYVMDFDHRDPTIKVASISAMSRRGAAQSRIAAEITKCDLVCANCHRERTHGEAS